MSRQSVGSLLALSLGLCFAVSMPLSASADTKSVAATKAKVKLGDPSLTAGIPGRGELTNPQIKAWLDDPANHVELEVDEHQIRVDVVEHLLDRVVGQ